LKTLLLAGVLFGFSAVVFAQSGCPPALDFHKRGLNSNEPIHLCEAFKNKVVLVVNTASKCAYTPQYEGLEKLHAKYQGQGFMVAGFPSNDFAGQEPGSEKQIKDFCRLTYGVQFPMYEKSRVRGNTAEPFYRHLAEVTNDKPQWNFHKYLINRNGEVVASFPSRIEPMSDKLIKAIEALL
jgi:glutathione peroxidase